MTNKGLMSDGSEHDPRLQRLLNAVPAPIRRFYLWLIRPESRWARWPIGLALIAGGFLGFLPILGFWMIPLGALVIGEDVPILRRWTLAGIGRIQSWWDRRRRQ